MAIVKGDDNSNSLYGTPKADKIYGYAGDDFLYGYAGNDVLNGSDGADEIFGGPGNDTLIPGSNTDYDWIVPGTGKDTVDFTLSTPEQGYFNLVHNDLANGVAIRIDGTKNTGFVDKGVSGTTSIININNALAFDGDDGGGLRLIGTASDDSYILRLSAGQQIEIRDGGGGNDSIVLKSAAGLYSLSYTWEPSGVTADLLATKANGFTRTVTSNGTVTEVDTITGAGDIYRFRGTDYDDTVLGSDATYRIYTYSGDDRIVAQSTSHDFSWIDPGTGNDIVDFRQLTAGTSFYNIGHNESSSVAAISVTVNSATNTASIDKGAQGVTTILGVKTAMAGTTPFQDAPYDGGGLRIAGTWGDDSYSVSIGVNETLQIREFGGSDTIEINANSGYLVLSYRYAKTGINADLTKGRITATDDSGDVDSLTGSGHLNELRATQYADRLLGSAQDELFAPGRGNDYVDGKKGVDFVEYTQGSDFRDPTELVVDLARGTATGKNNDIAFTDTLKNIEGVFGTSNEDVLLGSKVSNTLSGRSGQDTLSGQAGNDVLIGGADDDILTGGAGFDRFVFANNDGNDRITDFNALSGKEDIDLSAVTRIKTFKDLQANHMSQLGADVVIDDGAGTTITLEKVQLADLDKGDFLF